ncbi:MAG: YeeE/YedE thiosulfate transporter family protein [Rhodospirillaceae bacterium]
MPMLTVTVLGLSVGAVFGFALEKSRAFEPGLVVGQVQLRRFVMVKVWLTALATALLCLTLLAGLGIVHLHPKPLALVGDLAGGVLFGFGMALAGGCPAAAMAQLGAGYKDVWFTLAGGVAGVAAYALLEPLLRPLLAAAPGAPTVAELFDMPAIAWAVAVDVALFACLVTLERLQPWTCDLGPDADGVHEEGMSPPTRCLTENAERARLS